MDNITFRERVRKAKNSRSIEALLGFVVSTGRQQKYVYSGKTKEQAQKRLKALFSRNNSQDLEAKMIQRKTNLQLQDRPFQHKLLRGLTQRFSETTIQVQPTTNNKSPIKLEKSNSPPKSKSPQRLFSTISGQFSQWGPARSVAAITAKTLFQNRIQKDLPVEKIQVKENVNQTMKLISSTSPEKHLIKTQNKNQRRKLKLKLDVEGMDIKSRNDQYQTSECIQNLMDSLHLINTHKLQMSNPDSHRELLRPFSARYETIDLNKLSASKLFPNREVQKGNIQTKNPSEIKPNYQINKKPSIFYGNPFNSPTALQVYLNRWNPIEDFERESFRNFLYNNWITAVLKFKTLQVDSDKNTTDVSEKIRSIMSTHVEVQKVFKSQNHSNYARSLQNSPIQTAATSRKSSVYESTSNYAREKRDFQINNQKRQSERIACLNMFKSDIIYKQDQDNLAEFDIYYERIIKRKRLLDKLQFYLVRCKRMNIPLDHVVDFVRSHSQQCYQRSGSFAFIQALKSENFKYCQDLLQKNPGLINDFNYMGETPLHIAVRRNNVQMVQFVLAQNTVDIEMINQKDQTPLQLALQLGHEKIQMILLLCSANPWRQVTRNRMIKIACYCWIKLKCPSIYKNDWEKQDSYRQRIFQEMEWYFIYPKSMDQPLSNIYYDTNVSKLNY